MTEAKVSSIEGRRGHPSRGRRPHNVKCPNCGNEWFMTKVVVQEMPNGDLADVVGYKLPLMCVECGEAVE